MGYRAVSWIDQLSQVAKHNQKPAVYISGGLKEFTFNAPPAAPYLTGEQTFVLYTEGSVLLLCDDMDEAYSLYKQTVGDDGPTESNPYDGEERLYAMLIDADGKVLTENT